MKPRELVNFIRESNRIERITREPTLNEIEAHATILRLGTMGIGALCKFVNVVAHGAKLRDKDGMNVRVGLHIPPFGGPHVQTTLQNILDRIHAGRLSAYAAHVEYERLHPFTDGNGRSGRALWLWQHNGNAPLGFLHTFYYEALRATP